MPANPFTVEAGTRQLNHVSVAYDLFVPNRAVVGSMLLLHGFMGSRSHHRNLSEVLAASGISVCAPDMLSLLGGDASRDTNVALAVDHIRALVSRFPDVPVGLGGHSAGGGIAWKLK